MIAACRRPRAAPRCPPGGTRRALRIQSCVHAYNNPGRTVWHKCRYAMHDTHTLYTHAHVYAHASIMRSTHPVCQHAACTRQMTTCPHSAIRWHQTCDFGEHATSAPAELGDQLTMSREIAPVRRSLRRSGSRTCTKVARLVHSGCRKLGDGGRGRATAANFNICLML